MLNLAKAMIFSENVKRNLVVPWNHMLIFGRLEETIPVRECMSAKKTRRIQIPFNRLSTCEKFMQILHELFASEEKQLDQ